jgi:hypothetical protein
MKLTNVISVIALVSVMTSGATALAGDWKLGGYVDGQYEGLSNHDSAAGFVVHEGALFINKEMDGSEVRIALPMSSRGAGANSLTFATGMAEAWVGHKYSNGFRWKLGQWAGIFGSESNFSADRALTRKSITNTVTTPTTNTGLNAGYDLGKEITFDVYASDPNSQGTLTAGDNMEFGGRLGFAPEIFHLSVGYAMRKIGTENRTLLDLTAGANLGGFSLDAQFDMLKPEVAGADTGTALLFQALYAHSDVLSFAGRFEMLNKVATVNGSTFYGVTTPTPGLYKVMSVAVGPQYQLSKELKAKFDYTYTSFKNDTLGTDADKGHAYILAAVYSFK